VNLLDDSLSADQPARSKLTEAMTERFLTLSATHAGTGSGRDPVHLLRLRSLHRSRCARARADAGAQPNEAMIEEAVSKGRKIGLLSSFPPTLASMPREFPLGIEIVPKLADGALAALDRGDRATHDRLVVEASKDLGDCDLIALAQYSMAPAAGMVAEASGRPVVTTPDSAVLKLKQMLRG
jgi:hypothetical protein